MTPGDMIISIIGGILLIVFMWVLGWIARDFYDLFKKDDWSDP